MNEPVPTVWASIGQTINLGNYENIKLDIGVSGVPVGASEEYIAEKMDAAQKTLHQVVEALAMELKRRVTEDIKRG